MSQLELPFADPFLGENHALWTPRDIWVRLNQGLLEALEEDTRFERKGGSKVHFDDLATYFSTFANTPDGGLVANFRSSINVIVCCNIRVAS